MKMETINLSVSYGRVRAIQRVSLGIEDCAVTALIGPSGCGKSTFLRALNRMHDLAPGTSVRGRILLDGQPISALSAEGLRRRVGMVFQRPNPFPMSIFDNVAFGPTLVGVQGRPLENLVRESLQRAALWDEVRRRLQVDARSLSGGQQQRLCIARALAMAPEVLLMDEPSSALDPAASAAVEALIGALKADMAIVIVTHSLPQAWRVADKVVRFEAGLVVAMGPKEQVLDHAKWA
jgi:phosphate transport system ATP-binding protein